MYWGREENKHWSAYDVIITKVRQLWDLFCYPFSLPFCLLLFLSPEAYDAMKKCTNMDQVKQTFIQICYILC